MALISTSEGKVGIVRSASERIFGHSNLERANTPLRVVCAACSQGQYDDWN
jgi:hypothetical protein